MRKKYVIGVAVVALLATLAVASPSLIFSWKNPDYANGNFKNILVLALNGKVGNRLEFEDEFVAATSRPGAKVTQSYVYISRPNDTAIDMKDLRELVKEQQFDAILVARLTVNDTKTTYVPGQAYVPYPYYGTFYGYYSAIAPIVYSPGYMKTERKAQVEVNVYSTAKPDGELVWTGTTDTFSSNSAIKVIKDLVKIYAKALEKENIIQQQAK